MHAHRLRSATASLAAVLAAVVAAPLVLIAVSRTRLGSAQPLRGMQAPWHWSLDEVRQWMAALGDGFDRSDQLVDLFVRIALVVAWLCVAVLVVTTGREVVFQLRHGMPSTSRRRGPFRSLAGFVAAGLVGVLPVAGAAAPALAASPAVSVTHGAAQVTSALDAPMATVGHTVEVVRAGDSVWSIAERVAAGGDVSALAQRIVDVNLGRTMNDGARFVTGALIEPGWQLQIPTDQPPSTHTVRSGDSYWAVSEDHLDEALQRDATNREVLEYVHRMMDQNAPLLHHRDPALIIPGEVLQFPAIEAAVEPAAPQVVVDVPLAAEPLPAWAAEPAFADPRPLPAVAAPALPDLAAPEVAVSPPTAPVISAPIELPVAVPDVAVDADTGVGSPLVAATSLTLAAGVLALARRRRRASLRSAGVGARLARLEPVDSAVERAIAAPRPVERMLRIELGLRAAGPALAAAGDRPLAVLAGDDGAIRLVTERTTMPSGDVWRLDLGSDHWVLPAAVSVADLATLARSIPDPCPLLVHIGRSGDADLFVDLEAAGVVCVDAASSDAAAGIVRAIVAAISVSALAEGAQVVAAGTSSASVLRASGSPAVVVDDAHAALDEVVRWLGSTSSAVAGNASTFALRMRGGGEQWSPALVGSTELDWSDDAAARVCDVAAGGGRGVAVVIDRPIEGPVWTIRERDGAFEIDGLALPVEPIGLPMADLLSLSALVERSGSVLTIPAPFRDEASVGESPSWAEPEWEVLVRVLGNVGVETRSGIAVAFDRSKSLELVAWLSQHPERPTRMAARTALWDLDVRDATFANVVSDARRSMARVAELPVGEEWIARTLTEQIPLHRLVITDAALLAARLAASAHLGHAEAVDVIRPGLELVTAGPFADASFLWPDAEGTTTSLVLLVTGAATVMAEHCLALDDVDGVFWATGQGLKALPGHEELISLRMRAHAGAGDLSGVRQEWEAYERALAADPWADDEPAPKLVDLRRRLLAPSMAG